MNTDFVQSASVQDLLDRASGLDTEGGDPRLQHILRDLIESVMTLIVKHDISESEFWTDMSASRDGMVPSLTSFSLLDRSRVERTPAIPTTISEITAMATISQSRLATVMLKFFMHPSPCLFLTTSRTLF